MSADRRANDKKKGVEVKGAVVLMKKHVMDMTDLRASVVDRVYEFFGRRVSFQLVSATVGDPSNPLSSADQSFLNCIFS